MHKNVKKCIGYSNEYPIQELNSDSFKLQFNLQKEHSRNISGNSLQDQPLDFNPNEFSVIETKKSTSKTI